jgi:hypothetical protein
MSPRVGGQLTASVTVTKGKLGREEVPESRERACCSTPQSSTSRGKSDMR